MGHSKLEWDEGITDSNYDKLKASFTNVKENINNWLSALDKVMKENHSPIEDAGKKIEFDDSYLSENSGIDEDLKRRTKKIIRSLNEARNTKNHNILDKTVKRAQKIEQEIEDIFELD
ncbi:hypothetical protein AGMMS49942_05330 [Spirochaetia bacterium]|nr:hypothetical protein AGMMS49942_05330 [Spirochaetia bacterium]